MRLLTTDRLELKHTEITDALFLLELYNTPKWIQYIGDRHIKTVDDASQYIKERLLPQIEKSGFGNYIIRYEGKPVGVCGLYDRPELEGVDLGFALHPDYEGRGFAIESARALMAMAWEEYSFDKISAITLEVNTSSIQVLQKLGFSFLKKVRFQEDAEELLLYEALSKNN